MIWSQNLPSYYCACFSFRNEMNSKDWGWQVTEHVPIRCKTLSLNCSTVFPPLQKKTIQYLKWILCLQNMTQHFKFSKVVRNDSYKWWCQSDFSFSVAINYELCLCCDWEVTILSLRHHYKVDLSTVFIVQNQN
jgi:hypothetical protein